MNMENQLFTTLKLNRLCKNVNFSKINLDEIKGQIISIREGEVLFREGDSADSIFLIVSGEINIIKKRIIKFDRTPAFITITSINFNAKTYHILFHLEKKAARKN